MGTDGACEIKLDEKGNLRLNEDGVPISGASHNWYPLSRTVANNRFGSVFFATRSFWQVGICYCAISPSLLFQTAAIFQNTIYNCSRHRAAYTAAYADTPGSSTHKGKRVICPILF
jgi:hypothetical protein